MKYYKYSLKMSLLNILSIVLFILAYIPFFKIPIIINDRFLFFIIILLYLIVHEVLHGIGFALFAKDKKNIKFGITLEKGVFYALCQEEISKVGIIVSLLFPLIFLTFIPYTIGLIISNATLGLLASFNFGGAIGDIVMVLLIMKLPKDIKYIDYNNDVGAYILSKSDISKYKSIGITCVEVDNHDKNKIDKSIKRFYISKTSSIILIFVLLLFILLRIIGG